MCVQDGLRRLLNTLRAMVLLLKQGGANSPDMRWERQVGAGRGGGSGRS